jgi:hypothetical protein
VGFQIPGTPAALVLSVLVIVVGAGQVCAWTTDYCDQHWTKSCSGPLIADTDDYDSEYDDDYEYDYYEDDDERELYDLYFGRGKGKYVWWVEDIVAGHTTRAVLDAVCKVSSTSYPNQIMRC